MTAHFKMSEFSSPSVVNGKASYSKRLPVPQMYLANVDWLMRQLEVIRIVIGNKSMRIASGWRGKEFNGLSRGRASRSKHLTGEAADLYVKGVSPARLYWVISDLIASGDILPGGLAKYSTFVHYDTRGRYKNGRMARWKPAPQRPKSGLGAKQ